MKKICVYGGVLVVMLVSLGACGDGKEEQADTGQLNVLDDIRDATNPCSHHKKDKCNRVSGCAWGENGFGQTGCFISL